MNISSSQHRSLQKFVKFLFVSRELATVAGHAEIPHAAFSGLEVTFRYKRKQWVYVEGAQRGTWMAWEERDAEIREGL